MGGINLYLRHFPETDPPSKLSKEDEQDAISRQVAEFLAHGGQVQEVAYGESGQDKSPHRTRDQYKRDMKHFAAGTGLNKWK